MIERALHGDISVCGTRNQAAFDWLRTLLIMHDSVRDDALAAPGVKKTRLLVEQIVTSLRERIGERQGGPGLT